MRIPDGVTESLPTRMTSITGRLLISSKRGDPQSELKVTFQHAYAYIGTRCETTAHERWARSYLWSVREQCCETGFPCLPILGA